MFILEPEIHEPSQVERSDANKQSFVVLFDAPITKTPVVLCNEPGDRTFDHGTVSSIGGFNLLGPPLGSGEELTDAVCQAANTLTDMGVTAGDRVAIYMPIIPETVIAMLACARIGAPHTVVFGGFSSEALRTRIIDCDAHVVITADGGYSQRCTKRAQNRRSMRLSKSVPT